MLKHCVVYIACLWHLSTIPINLILTPTTLCHNEMSMRVGVEAEFWCTKLKLVKWEITLSKLGLSLHGVADPHRQKGQLCHTTSGIISPDTIVEKPLALRVVTPCGCHYN